MKPFDMDRRYVVLALAATPAVALADVISRQDVAVEALRRGNSVALIRHASTVAGLGDPPQMRLDDCSTQRNLSDEGREQSRRIGQWFASRQLMPSRVRSSQWCRCLDTAKMAFSRDIMGADIPIEPWVALNSFFQGQGDRNRQLQDAMQAARSIAMRKSFGQFDVWVTHHVVIGALTGHYPASGEMVVARYTEDSKPLQMAASGLIF